MAKINILFDEKNYSIDEANLAPATNALKAHLETLKEQGVPEFGTDWKFKDTITIDEIKQVASHYPPDEQGMHTIYKSSPSGIYIQIMDLDTLLSQEPDFVPEGKMGTVYTVVNKPSTTYSGDIWFYLDRSELTDYGYEILSQAMPNQVPSSPDKLPGWFLAEDGEVVATGPTIPSVPESSGINLEYVAPLFDVPGVDGDTDITLDGAVYKVDSTKLAPATNSLIAHLETLKGGEGGTLVEGETYTLKNEGLENIDPSGYMNVAFPLMAGTYAVAQLGRAYLVYATPEAVLELMGGNEPNTDAWIYLDMSAGVCYMYPFKPYAGAIIGWVDKNTGEKITEPISATISPIDETQGLPTLDEIAVFFDLGGGSGNGGDTKIVINGVEYFVDSAKLAEAKSALAEHLKALEDAVEDELAGTWVFNDRIENNAPVAEWSIKCDFISNGIAYTWFSHSIPTLFEYFDGVSTTRVYEYSFKRWTNEAYKTVKINTTYENLSEFYGVDAETFLTWLKANATKQ